MRRRRIFHKYALVMVALVATTLAIASLVQVVVIYRSQRALVEHVLKVESGRAAERIANFVALTVGAVSTLSDFDQPGSRIDVEALRQGVWRVMRRHDAISGVRVLDGRKCVVLRVSRLDPDEIGECGGAAAMVPGSEEVRRAPSAAGPSEPRFGPVYYPDGSEPHLELVVPSRGTGTGSVEVQLSLKRIHATVASIRFGEKGRAYVVDDRNRLVAHPDLSLVLRREELKHVADLRTPAPEGQVRGDSAAHLITGMRGDRVLTTWAQVGKPDWRVFVEQPAIEALRPVYESVLAALAAFAIAVLVAAAASFLLARRLAEPILALREGAARLGNGDLATRIKVEDTDEVAELAQEFNHMADRLGELHSGLERKVAERTSELARAKAQADTANAAKTRFLAAASHDLRQPMHAISLLVGLLQERTGPSANADLIGKIAMSVQGMESLFSNLLDISKLDSGAVKPTIEPFPASQLLQRVELQFAEQAIRKGATLRVMPCSALIRSDPGLLERILSNLVANAVRYTVRGKILVGCRRVHGTLRFMVMDTGIGIAPQHLGSIFEEFFQVNDAPRERDNGLGLGLSIVKRSADLLGHRISVRSTAGRGSCFAIDVPLVEPFAKMPASASATEPADVLRSAFVLVVDDDADSRFATEALCHQWGASVETAASRAEALGKLDKHLRAPDLILCDYRLGDRDTGPQAVAALRSHIGQQTPAIFITADVSIAATEIGAHSMLLRKPVGAETLQARALELLAQARSPA